MNKLIPILLIIICTNLVGCSIFTKKPQPIIPDCGNCTADVLIQAIEYLNIPLSFSDITQTKNEINLMDTSTKANPTDSETVLIKQIKAHNLEYKLFWKPTFQPSVISEVFACHPVIVLLNYGTETAPENHFIVIIGIDEVDKTFTIKKNSGSSIKMSFQELEKNHSDFALAIAYDGFKSSCKNVYKE